ncbi:ATP/GTP-binding protein [Actinosynnema sp. NPDC053489]|uniref:ATP/GTP-binding protein n=1 Tax=Actinosynnema sp. NPDC053489 TaxID=3363916 RepID=UPI0037C73328
MAAVYGANASGKSNLLDGLEFMADAVRDSFMRWQPFSGVPRSPFKLDLAAADRVSVFVAEFVEHGVRYTYGFEVNDDRVLAEWLYSYPEKRKRVLFDRTDDHVRFGRSIAVGTEKLDVLERFLRPNALFLSLAAQFNTPDVMPVYRWFTRKLRFRLNDDHRDVAARVVAFLADHGPHAERLVELLHAADVGISELRLDGPDDLRLVHGDRGVLRLEEESAGTRSWLGLLPEVLRVLVEGGVLVIDEIDASLHSLLSARLVALFNDPESNRGYGQLVFTTHDATLLHPPLADEVLDRDEVWFVEKDREGASRLYPLSDFKPRREDNLERRYLAGQYGAVPHVYEEHFKTAVRDGVFSGQA